MGRVFEITSGADITPTTDENTYARLIEDRLITDIGTTDMDDPSADADMRTAQTLASIFERLRTPGA